MRRRCTVGVRLVAVLAIAVAWKTPAAEAASPVDFAKDVQPIFASTCYECHGAEKQKGGLRLDARSAAMKGGKTGRAIVPNEPKKSLLISRILGEGDDERMPAKKDPLTAGQVAVIRAWIDQGAHWPDSLAGANVEVGQHWAYVKPVAPALPKISRPEWAKNGIDYFVAARLEKEGLAPSPEASKEILIRRVSLDLTGLPPTPAEVEAFVADTAPGAYERVVDRLLASPTYGERWARPWLDLARYADTNGYEKDGRRTIWKYRDWVIDALNRDMPFDQFTIEQIAGDMLPKATTDTKIATGFHRNTMTNEEGGVDKAEQRWLVLVDRVNTTGSVWLGSTIACAQCHNHKYDPFSSKDFYSFLAFWENADETQLKVTTPAQEAATKEIAGQVAKAEETLKSRAAELDQGFAQWDGEWSARSAATAPATKPAVTAPALPANVLAVLKVPAAKRDANQKKALSDYFRGQDARYKKLSDALADLKNRQKGMEAAAVTTLVLTEKPSSEPPKTFVRVRGSFLSKGDEVSANVPSFLGSFPTGETASRLAMARWLVSNENPLTARVTVNRFWEAYFGRGIVETPEDFGTQGDRPTHPELLDFLATQFMEQKWGMKAIHRLIVTSATYRQSSAVNAALVEKDPYNRLYARGPRFRMEAEMIRDAALATAGLLVQKVGGPSVMPYQPEGIWNLPYNSDKWAVATNEDRYRRGVYTFWRRTAPYPAFMTLDASSREYCTVRRVRTNTPLQALNLLNDPAFFEAARGMARRVMKESSADASARAEYAFRLAVARRPKANEQKRLAALYAQQLEQFAKDPAAVKNVAGVEKADAAAAELAAWTMVCNVLLNLDETLTKE